MVASGFDLFGGSITNIILPTQYLGSTTDLLFRSNLGAIPKYLVYLDNSATTSVLKILDKDTFLLKTSVSLPARFYSLCSFGDRIVVFGDVGYVVYNQNLLMVTTYNSSKPVKGVHITGDEIFIQRGSHGFNNHDILRLSLTGTLLSSTVLDGGYGMAGRADPYVYGNELYAFSGDSKALVILDKATLAPKDRIVLNYAKKDVFVLSDKIYINQDGGGSQVYGRANLAIIANLPYNVSGTNKNEIYAFKNLVSQGVLGNGNYITLCATDPLGNPKRTSVVPVAWNYLGYVDSNIDIEDPVIYAAVRDDTKYVITKFTDIGGVIR